MLVRIREKSLRSTNSERVDSDAGDGVVVHFHRLDDAIRIDDEGAAQGQTGFRNVQEAGKGGEIQLTDALQEMAEHGIAGGVYGVVFRGRRYDTGDRVDYIKAIVQLAVERDDLGPELRPWLKQFAADLD